MDWGVCLYPNSHNLDIIEDFQLLFLSFFFKVVLLVLCIAEKCSKNAAA